MLRLSLHFMYCWTSALSQVLLPNSPVMTGTFFARVPIVVVQHFGVWQGFCE